MEPESELAAWVSQRLGTIDLRWPGLPPRPETVVVGNDGSAGSVSATQWAVRLGRDVHVVHAKKLYTFPGHRALATELGAGVGVEVEEVTQQGLERESDVAYNAVAPQLHGVKVSRHTVKASPARAILETATEVDAGLIAVGHTGKGLIDRATLGSVSEAVAHHAARTTIVARHGPIDGPVIAGVDAGLASERAAAWATAMAVWLDRPLILAHAGLEGIVLKRFHFDGPNAQSRIVEWPAAAGLSALARSTRACAIVVGHGILPGWLGSTAIGLLRSAPCSVVIARAWDARPS